MSDFEDPTQLARCIKSDCQGYRAGGTPLCAAHLHEQEKAAGATAIIEPEVEARVAKVRTEDDDHPGMVKVYDKDTGKPSWVPAAQEKYVGPDPDTNGLYKGYREEDPIPEGAAAILRGAPDPTELEPRWDGTRWVLEPKRMVPDLKAVRSLVRELMHELNIPEAEGAYE
jgi:hypothetical protein